MCVCVVWSVGVCVVCGVGGVCSVWRPPARRETQWCVCAGGGLKERQVALD